MKDKPAGKATKGSDAAEPRRPAGSTDRKGSPTPVGNGVETPQPAGFVAKHMSLFLLLGLLFGAVSILCYQAYQPHQTMWANDSHLGALKDDSIRLPGIFTGEWVDFWWIGFEAPAAAPTVTMIFGTFLSPEMYLKLYTPFTAMVLGFCAWVLFRSLKFSPWVCVLGGLAAGLNMHCFSNACWGTGTWNISIAMVFLAVAAIVTEGFKQLWLKAVFAGLAAGMAVMEGFDSGAILSVYIGVFVLFFCWISESTLARRISKAAYTGTLVVVAAVLIAASTLASLFGTQIAGVTDLDAQRKWDFSTEWSLPKLESLRVIIPGLFGYRISEYTTPPPKALSFLMASASEEAKDNPHIIDKSPAYWGKVGQDPQIDRIESSDPEVRAKAAASVDQQFVNMLFGISGRNPKPTDEAEARQKLVSIMRDGDPATRQQVQDALKGAYQRRFSGNGEYAGVITALFAVLAVLHAWRRGASALNLRERSQVWFWALASLFSLMAAWGRFGFLYSIIYHFPMVDKIRNPTKFMHPFVVCWVILAGFGMEAFYRCYLKPKTEASAAGKALDHRSWWQKLSAFDKNFFIGTILVLGAIFVGYISYASYQPKLVEYLARQGFSPGDSAIIARYSVCDVAWFVGILVVSTALVLSAIMGLWSVASARWLWSALCFVLVFEMVRADMPWIRYFDYTTKYSMNEITQLLMEKPYEHRFVGRLSPQGGYDLPGDGDFAAAIHWWLENDFPYHNIQSLEIDQMPRSPVMDMNYIGAFFGQGKGLPAVGRFWQLTNTRYVFANAGALDTLNGVVTPGRNAFHYLKRFNFVTKPGVQVREDAGDIEPQMNDQGSCTLIEYDDALPRTKLYSHWLVPPNDDAALQALSNPTWNPKDSVLVSQPTNGAALPPSSSDPNADPGTATITRYSPKDIEVQASAKTPAILLYNDRIGPNWRVWVDGKPSELLRCNYIMRGVQVPPGDHKVEFKFAPSLVSFSITWTTVLAGLGLILYVVWPRADKIAIGAAIPAK